ncbi:MAG: hypothetical protein Q8Q23_04990 [bacterium]|nr:hypothetical protein [bacterium]
MSGKKITIFIIITAILIIAGFLLAPRIAAYYEWQNVVEAASAMPWQDGGTITMVNEPCILDTPPPPATPVTCSHCPFVSASVAPGQCEFYIELVQQSQHGTQFMAVPVAFDGYRGGGTHPRAGTQYIAGGASNVVPWIIGIPK